MDLAEEGGSVRGPSGGVEHDHCGRVDGAAVSRGTSRGVGQADHGGHYECCGVCGGGFDCRWTKNELTDFKEIIKSSFISQIYGNWLFTITSLAFFPIWNMLWRTAV